MKLFFFDNFFSSMNENEFDLFQDDFVFDDIFLNMNENFSISFDIFEIEFTNSFIFYV